MFICAIITSNVKMIYIYMSTLPNINLLEEYIIIYGLKNKMQAIRIFYLVGIAQCKHETYAITYNCTVVQLWRPFIM